MKRFYDFNKGWPLFIFDPTLRNVKDPTEQEKKWLNGFPNIKTKNE